MDALFNQEILLRAGSFAALLLTIAVAELIAPRRSLALSRTDRWIPNLGLGTLNILILRFVFPMLGVSLAALAGLKGWGLFNVWPMPFIASFALSVVILDLAIWAQHRLFHRIPMLWRMHRMHHTDPDFDVTTAVRFHPLEAVLSMMIKSAVILLIGVDPLAFLAFELLLSSTSLFNHGNLRLPAGMDRVLRWFIVTPDMHRVHHSVLAREQNSNFGFNLPWWDRLFGTYRDQPEQGHEHMTIGTGDLETATDQKLTRLLAQPFGPIRET
jgi:sterol desaturase/sphingolipid hydroxylase (fatty acid hydroxylase superfamily)